MADFRIRQARESDLTALTRLYNHYVEHTPITFDLTPFEPEQRRPWLESFASRGRYRLLVAESDADLLGYAGSHRFRERAAYDPTVESSVYVAPGAQRRGVGRALYEALFTALSTEDVRAMIAGITLPNPASVAFHEGFGFQQCGVMRGIGRKFDRMWDVGWYQRVVSPSVDQ